MLKISKSDWQTIKAHYEIGVPITKLAARYNISVPTCRRYIAMSEAEFEKLESEQHPYMDSYREFILEELKTNPQIQKNFFEIFSPDCSRSSRKRWKRS